MDDERVPPRIFLYPLFVLEVKYRNWRAIITSIGIPTPCVSCLVVGFQRKFANKGRAGWVSELRVIEAGLEVETLRNR